MTDRFAVLSNDSGQYGLHPADQEPPSGWRPAGFAGTEADCVHHVDEQGTAGRAPAGNAGGD